MEIKHKPIISYYKHGDPTKDYSWTEKLTDINIIKTKVIDDNFIRFCVDNKHRIYLHVVVSGLAQTVFEPKIPTVKETFLMMKKLIEMGFPRNQILVVTEVIQNENGLKTLMLLLKVFTQFKDLRLRQCRITTIGYKSVAINFDKGSEHIIKGSYKKEKMELWNSNITKRKEFKPVEHYTTKTDTFFREFKDLLNKYVDIIFVDEGIDIPLIGLRELKPFGLTNIWVNEKGEQEKIIVYENGSRFKPIVTTISNMRMNRCSNRCLLCIGIG